MTTERDFINLSIVYEMRLMHNPGMGHIDMSSIPTSGPRRARDRSLMPHIGLGDVELHQINTKSRPKEIHIPLLMHHRTA